MRRDEGTEDAQLAALDAIRSLLAEAIVQRQVVDANVEAARIAQNFPDSGMTPEDIAEELIALAGSSGVPVRIASSG